MRVGIAVLRAPIPYLPVRRRRAVSVKGRDYCNHLTTKCFVYVKRIYYSYLIYNTMQLFLYFVIVIFEVIGIISFLHTLSPASSVADKHRIARAHRFQQFPAKYKHMFRAYYTCFLGLYALNIYILVLTLYY